MLNLVIMVGTRGELIKTAPVMRLLRKRGLGFLFINLSQHTASMTETMKLFGIPKSDIAFKAPPRDVSNLSEAMRWILRNLTRLDLSNVINKKSLAVVHGDASSTFVSSIVAKFKGAKLAHIEAGERTYSLLDPFPEELIRRVVDKMSDYLFCCSDRAYVGASRENLKGKIYNVKLNTLIDSVRLALQKSKSAARIHKEYVLAWIHRFETISSRPRLMMLVEVFLEISKRHHVIFPLHSSTMDRLMAYGLMDLINEEKGIHTCSPMNYFTFIEYMQDAAFVVTDSAGPQQEAFYLGIPCLLLRRRTERPGQPNVFISGFDIGRIRFFLKNYEHFRMKPILEAYKSYSPSEVIVNILEEILF